MTDALDVLLVIDFTTTIADPHCTRLLADLGSEVVKVESPQGDVMCSRVPLRNGARTSFGQLIAGKESLVRRDGLSDCRPSVPCPIKNAMHRQASVFCSSPISLRVHAYVALSSCARGAGLARVISRPMDQPKDRYESVQRAPTRVRARRYARLQWVTMSHPDAQLERQLWRPNPTNSPTVAEWPESAHRR